MADIRFHPEAQDEYRDALAWYHARSPRAAERFEAETDRVLESIAANPRLFPLYEADQRYAMLRRFPYSVVYQVRPDRLDVIAVAHSRRSPGYWKDRA